MTNEGNIPKIHCQPDQVSESAPRAAKEVSDVLRPQPLVDRDVNLRTHKTETELTSCITNKTQISTEEVENTEVKQLNISTRNRYEVLSDSRETMENSPSRESSQNLPVEMIMDSHGNRLDPKWIYKNKSLKVTVLGNGKKNISGAVEHMKKIQTPKHLIIGVGCNDLSNENPENVVKRFRNLVESVPQNPFLHVLPLFKRVGETDYNRKIEDVNKRLKIMCGNRKQSNIFFVEKKKNLDHEYNYTQDGIHFSDTGRRNLVSTIKEHLNPFLGMKPYGQYKKSVYRHETQRQPRLNVHHNHNLGLPQIRDLVKQLSYLV